MTLAPIGPPLVAVARLLDRPGSALSLAWTYPLGDQQPVIVDRRLVLLESGANYDAPQRYAVLDAATGVVVSRAVLPKGRALCPSEWHGSVALSAPTHQCDPFALVSFDLARTATRWRVMLAADIADNTAVLGEAVRSAGGHTNIVRFDIGILRIEHARIDETTGAVQNLPALHGVWRGLFPEQTATVGDTLFLAVTTGAPLAEFRRGLAAGLAYFNYPPPNSVQAISARTGELLWSHVDAEIRSLVSDAAHVVYLGNDDRLVVLDARDGAVVRRRLTTRKCFRPSFLAGDLLFGHTCNEPQSSMAIDLRTGRVRWKDHRVGWSLTADLVLLRDPDIDVAVPVALTTGEPVWGAPGLPLGVRAFEVAGTRLLIGSDGATLTALRVEDEPAPPRCSTWTYSCPASPSRRRRSASGSASRSSERSRLRYDLQVEQCQRAGQAGLQRAECGEAGEVDAQLDDRAGDRRGQADEDQACAEQTDGARGTDDVLGGLAVEQRNTGDIEDDDLGPRLGHSGQHRLREQLGAQRIQDPDQRDDQDAVVHRGDRRRRLADDVEQARLLLEGGLELVQLTLELADLELGGLLLKAALTQGHVAHRAEQGQLEHPLLDPGARVRVELRGGGHRRQQHPPQGHAQQAQIGEAEPARAEVPGDPGQQLTQGVVIGAGDVEPERGQQADDERSTLARREGLVDAAGASAQAVREVVDGGRLEMHDPGVEWIGHEGSSYQLTR